jgi:recombination protein RecA
MPRKKLVKTATEKTKPSRGKKKGEAEEVPISKSNKIHALQATMAKSYKGKGQIVMADALTLPYYLRRIPCGIIDLDIATGGGLPCGGLSEIYGPESVGKTLLLIQYMKMQQKIFGDECALGACMTEMHFDKLFGKMNGLRIPYSPEEIAHEEDLNGGPLTDEQYLLMRDSVGNFQEVMGSSAEYLYDMILDLIESQLYNILSIDSWGSLLTAEEEKKTMHDKTRGGAAKVNSEWLRRFSAMMNRIVEGKPNMTAVIGINQVRERMGAYGGFENPGGRALKHGKFVSIFLSTDGYIHADGFVGMSNPNGAHGPRVGKAISWRIDKGKAGCHDGPVGFFHYYYDGGVDLYRTAVISAQRYGILSASGSWLTFGDYRANGVDNFRELVANDPVLYDALEEACYAANKLRRNFR